MYARVATAQVQPGKMDDFLKIYTKAQRQILVPGKGFQSSRLLTDRNTGKAISVSIWETESDARASEAGSYQQEVTTRFGSVFTGATTFEYYEVSGEG